MKKLTYFLIFLICSTIFGGEQFTEKQSKIPQRDSLTHLADSLEASRVFFISAIENEGVMGNPWLIESHFEQLQGFTEKRNRIIEQIKAIDSVIMINEAFEKTK